MAKKKDAPLRYVNLSDGPITVYDERKRSVRVLPFGERADPRLEGAIFICTGAHYRQFVGRRGPLWPFPRWAEEGESARAAARNAAAIASAPAAGIAKVPAVDLTPPAVQDAPVDDQDDDEGAELGEDDLAAYTELDEDEAGDEDEGAVDPGEGEGEGGGEDEAGEAGEGEDGEDDSAPAEAGEPEVNDDAPVKKQARKSRRKVSAKKRKRS